MERRSSIEAKVTTFRCNVVTVFYESYLLYVCLLLTMWTWARVPRAPGRPRDWLLGVVWVPPASRESAGDTAARWELPSASSAYETTVSHLRPGSCRSAELTWRAAADAEAPASQRHSYQLGKPSSSSHLYRT